MRVAVCSAPIPSLDAAQAGAVIARAWAALGAQVALIPLTEHSPEMLDLMADYDPDAACWAGPTIASAPEFGQTSSEPVGRALLTGLTGLGDAMRIYADLTGAAACDDGGRGFASSMGTDAVAELRSLLAGRELIALVAPDEVSAPLVGLRGLASVRGRDRGLDLSTILEADQRIAAVGQRWGIDPEEPGAGAVGGVGRALLAAGATLVSPLDALIQASGLPDTIGRADLVVVGCEQLDFGAMGGPVVTEVVQLSANKLRPVVVVAGTNHVSNRELRTVGIEAAHAVRERHFEHAGETDESPISADELSAVAHRVAGSWHW